MLTNTGLFVNERKSFLADNKKGFTLVELIVVIAILVILALIGGIRFSAYIEQAESAKIKANLKTIHTAAEMVFLTNRDIDTDSIWDIGKDKYYKFIKELSEFTNL